MQTAQTSENLLLGVVSLANRNSGHDSLRPLFLAQVLGDQVATHAEADADKLRGRIPLREVRHHAVEVGRVAWN